MTNETKLSKLARLWRERRYAEIVHWGWCIVRDRFWVRRFYVVRLVPLERRRLRPRSVCVRQARPKDMDALNECWEKRELYEYRFKKGDVCVVAEVGAKVVGFVWFERKGLHREPDGSYSFDCRTDGVWVYDGYVVPSYRLKGVWVLLQEKVVQVTNGAGPLYAINYVHNHRSIKAHLRYGYRIHMRVTQVKVLGYILTFEKNETGRLRFRVFLSTARPLPDYGLPAEWQPQRHRAHAGSGRFLGKIFSRSYDRFSACSTPDRRLKAGYRFLAM